MSRNSMYYIIFSLQILVIMITISFADFSSEYALGSYGMVLLLFTVSIVGIIFGRIYGLILSMVGMLVYAGTIFYQSLLGTEAFLPLNYAWIISFPVTGLFSGMLGETIRQKEKLYEDCNQVSETLVTKDEMTGLGNAKEFYQNLKVEMSLARRHERVITISLIEIQYFDELLAIYGKQSYSRIFDLVTATLRKCTRTEDTLYRISEKTFAIIMPYTPKDGAGVVKSRIKDHLGEINTFTDKKFEEMKIEVRVGVASLDDNIRSELEFKKVAEKEVEYDV